MRKGTPNELRRDLYFLFMEGSWTRLLIAMGVFYILSNILFASLYMLEPSAISTLDQDPTSVVTDSGAGSRDSLGS